MRTRYLFATAVLSLAMVGAGAASFDCKKARAEDEKAICANPELSKLDEELAQAFKSAQAAMAGDTKRIAAFRRDQAEWIKDRARCGDTVSCLKNEYVDRIRWLQNPAQQYAGEWVSKTAKITFHVERDSGRIYVALYPDKQKGADQQDMVFMSIDAKFFPAKDNDTGEDRIVISAPQFSRNNAALKSTCRQIYLSFGTMEMMGLEADEKCPLLKGQDGDFNPSTPLFIYERSR
ncbi:lysozyme inhibitor LprI family protein [Andreprevotia chitinilytica]|uniref:lysozyme inhibitor LprI family protein n=1 Tax=Andreprevotia chitinilytica TaxID=396808 RepID=UPI001470729A|nr:lysozyme inhibitor LprI family protein [Andreprevotia chitinilytica]